MLRKKLGFKKKQPCGGYHYQCFSCNAFQTLTEFDSLINDYLETDEEIAKKYPDLAKKAKKLYQSVPKRKALNRKKV